VTDGAEGETERFASTALKWLLLDGNRFAVAALALAGVFAVLAGIGWGPEFVLAEPTPFFYVFSALVGGNLTLVTVVVSINQLVVSRQLMSAGEVRDQMRETFAYRDEVETVTDARLAPVEPDAFLDALATAALHELDRLGDARTAASGDRRDHLDAIVVPLQQHFDYVTQLLERSDTDVFEALATILDTDYSREIYQCQRLLAEHDLDDDTADAAACLLDLLEHLNVARQLFKTIYMQEELSYLSRVLVYVGVPAVLAAVLSLVAIAVESGPGLPWWVARVVFPVGVTAGLAPLAVLGAFVLRVATVTQLTAAPTPFIEIE
jgi:hypothetical protein